MVMDFNAKAPFDALFFGKTEVNTATGAIVLGMVNPSNGMALPGGADSVIFTGGWVKIDFATEAYEIGFTNPVTVPVTSGSNVVLCHASPVSGSGIQIFLVLVEFSQMVNEKAYPLQNGGFNCLRIMEGV